MENYLKSDDQRWGRERRKSRFQIEEQGNTEIHFIGISGRVPLRKPQYFLLCQNSVSLNYGHN